MSVITVTTPFNIDLEFKVAAFHKRLLAWLIDILIVYAYVILAYRFVIDPMNLYEELGQVASLLIVMIPAYCYHLFLEIFWSGQSVGKKAMGIKVMDMNGNEASLSQYLLRWSFRLFDMVITFGAAAILATALSKNSQRLGDMAAGTVVIDDRYQTNINETIYLHLEEDNYSPMFPQVMQLSDRDINGINNLLEGKTKGEEINKYVLQVVDRIKDFLKIETEMDAHNFLRQLLKDYNYITRK